MDGEHGDGEGGKGLTIGLVWEVVVVPFGLLALEDALGWVWWRLRWMVEKYVCGELV